MINSIRSPNELLNLASINLVLFYSDGCYHCRQFHDHWETVVSKIKNQHMGIKPLSIEQKHFHHLDKMGMYSDIQGVPSLVLLDDKGQYIQKYQGHDRHPDNIMSWLKTHTHKLSEMKSNLGGKKRNIRSNKTTSSKKKRTRKRKSKTKIRKRTTRHKKKRTKRGNYIILE